MDKKRAGMIVFTAALAGCGSFPAPIPMDRRVPVTTYPQQGLSLSQVQLQQEISRLSWEVQQLRQEMRAEIATIRAKTDKFDVRESGGSLLLVPSDGVTFGSIR